MDLKKNEAIVKLGIARTLLISSFFTLRSTDSLLEHFHSEDDLHRVNHLLYKAKTRYETLKVILGEAAPYSVIRDMEYALVKSFKEYYEGVSEIIHLQDWNLAEYEEINNEYHDAYFGEVDLDDLRSCVTISKKMSAFIPRLARETNFPNAYSKALLLARKVLNSIKLSVPNDEKVVRKITFSPGFTQAGIGLLSYFSEIISKKYPEMEVSVSIQQNGNTVTMSITHPDGKREEITHTLNNYGLVLTGKLNPEDLLEDKIQVLALRHKLEITKMEVSQVKEILKLERDNSKKRIETLETEVDSLKSIVGVSMQANQSTQEKLVDLFRLNIETNSENISLKRIGELSAAITERNEPKAELILDDMSTNEPMTFQKLNKLITEGAISGVIGNSAFSWLVAIINSLPK